ncbi:hypothetical protein A9Q99_11840 [Gammaproteobacteria bacterium 45_16_T64]|nr:hypothetical protein A9Q99_11840 [Gammaproteobacteria bacterium 45_16_T64]
MAEPSNVKSRLAIKLSRYTIFAALLIGLLLSSLQVLNDFIHQEDELDYIVLEIQEASLPSAVRSVTTLDKSLAEEIVLGLLKYNFIEEAEIVDDLGVVLAKDKKDIPVTSTTWLTDFIGDRHKNYRVELIDRQYQGMAPGQLNIVVNLDQVFDAFYNRSGFVLLSGVLRNVLLSFILIFVFLSVITRPLEKLSRQFESISIGDQIDTTLTVGHQHRDNELGALSDAGNHLLIKVNELLNENRVFNDSLIENEHRLLQLIDSLPQHISAQSSDGTIHFCNQSFKEFYGLDAGLESNKWLAEGEESNSEWVGLGGYRQRCIKEGRQLQVEAMVLTSVANKKLMFDVEFIPLSHFNERVSLVVANDVTDQIKSQEHIVYLATHDEVTRLPNRYSLKKRLSDVVFVGKDETSAVLFLDLDHFKNINDSEGHAVGDTVLVEVARMLSQQFSHKSMVSRFGGDEFVILMLDVAETREDAALIVDGVARTIIERITRVINLNEKIFHMGGSIGIMMFPFEDNDAESLLRFADTAMYEAKNKGRKQAVFYQTGMSRRVEYRHKMEMQLHDALHNQQFVIFFQPQVNVAGDIVGFEALLRWFHPDNGLVSPVEFIPLLETNGLIIEVSEWIVDQVCQQINNWKFSGLWLDYWKVCINISTEHFYHENFLGLFDGALSEYDIDAKSVCVEITESVAIKNVDFTMSRLQALRDIGISVALDDFGTGYSSLSYLKDLPINVLKIDRAFVLELETSDVDKAILRAIMDLAVALELTVVVEGVETLEQVGIARACGCHVFQGFYYHKPMPIDQLESMLRRAG